jgi:hypothetical protein
LYCFFFPQTELVLVHFLTNFYTYNFAEIHSCMYLWKLQTHCLYIFCLVKDSTMTTCCWIIYLIARVMTSHLKAWSSEEADLSHAIILITFTYVHCRDESSSYQEVAQRLKTKLYVLYTVLLTLITLLVMWICQIYRYGVKKIILPLHSVKAVVWCAVRAWWIILFRTPEYVAISCAMRHTWRWNGMNSSSFYKIVYHPFTVISTDIAFEQRESAPNTLKTYMLFPPWLLS